MTATNESDTVPREPGCQCQWEAGDSPCPVHDCRACHGNGEVEVAIWFDGAPGVDVAPCSSCGGTGQEPRR